MNKRNEMSLYHTAWSIILTAMAAMEGGTQLFEGAHLSDGNTHFCRESSKSHGLLGVKSSNSLCESF